MEITGTVSFNYEIVSQTYPPTNAGMNDVQTFSIEAPAGMLVIGGGYGWSGATSSGPRFFRPSSDGSAWEFGWQGPTIHSLTLWAVCISQTSA